jgi:hypothetical protein
VTNLPVYVFVPRCMMAALDLHAIDLWLSYKMMIVSYEGQIQRRGFNLSIFPLLFLFLGPALAVLGPSTPINFQQTPKDMLRFNN